MLELRQPIVSGTKPFRSCRQCKRGIVCHEYVSVKQLNEALRIDGWAQTLGTFDKCPACRTQKNKRDKHYWQRKYINEPNGMPFAYECTDHRKPYKVRHG